MRDFKAKIQTACPEEFASRMLRASKLIAEKFRRYMAIRTIASAFTGAFRDASEPIVEPHQVRLWPLAVICEPHSDIR